MLIENYDSIITLLWFTKHDAASSRSETLNTLP